MRVTPADRARFERQAAMLRAVDTAEELRADQVRLVLADGAADDADPPELELYRRGRALGMTRPRLTA